MTKNLKSDLPLFGQAAFIRVQNELIYSITSCHRGHAHGRRRLSLPSECQR